MLTESRGASSPNRAWRRYLIMLGLIVGALVALSFADVVSEVTFELTNSASSDESFYEGDRLVENALSGISFLGAPESFARKAIAYYEDELPSTAAYRRIGLTKRIILNESYPKELLQNDSPKATKDLSKRQIEQLTKEVRMWMDIYSLSRIDKHQADEYISSIKKLNVGPLEQAAIADVYKKSGHAKKAQTIMENVRENARKATIFLWVLGGVLLLLGIIGLLLACWFFVKYGSALKRSNPPRIQPNVLIISFLAYFLSFVFLSVIAGLIQSLSNISDSSIRGKASVLVLESFAMLGSFGFGISALRAITAYTNEDFHQIGLKMRSLIESIKWGVGGYCAALPFVGAAAWITKLIAEHLVKNVQLPEHPIIPVVQEGGWMLVVAVVLATVIAPIVEEVGFRGMLYGALRGKMGVWPSAAVSALVFALIHPAFPLQVLPIMALGIVLALLREKTGSLVAPIICHAINNTAALLLVLQQY